MKLKTNKNFISKNSEFHWFSLLKSEFNAGGNPAMA